MEKGVANQLSLTFDLEWWARANLLPSQPQFHEGLHRDLEALEQILDFLAETSLKATFFVVAKDFTSSHLQKIVKAGHEVASHSLDHPLFSKIPISAWKTQIVESKK